MPVLRAQVTIPMDTAIPADAVVNTFHFDAADAEGPTLTEISDNLTDFYTSILTVFGAPVNLPATTATYYDLDQPTPRPPLRIDTLAIPPDQGLLTMPSEVAIVMSFQGTVVPGEVRARHRGRIFLGPIATLRGDAQGRITTTTQTLIRDAGFAFQVSFSGSPTDWIVWSTVNVGPAAITPVTNGWVDNAFDTQRRRGVEASSRLLWPTA